MAREVERALSTRSDTKESIMLVVGVSFAGFFLSAFAAFSIFFVRMGAVPVWQGTGVATTAMVSSAASTAVKTITAAIRTAAKAALPTRVIPTTTPELHPLFSFRPLAEPRPDTRRVPANFKLAAPTLVSPAPGSAVRASAKSIELNWLAVPGAHRYHVHAWQMHHGDETALLDENVEGTTVTIEPVHRTLIHWEVQAFEANGTPGASSDPATIQLR